jgi:hypothetical protein
VSAVVTDVWGMKELVQSGVNGLVSPRDPEAVAAARKCTPVDSDAREARERARQSVVGRFGIGRTAAQHVRAPSMSSSVSKPLQQSWRSSR